MKKMWEKFSVKVSINMMELNMLLESIEKCINILKKRLDNIVEIASKLIQLY